MNKYRFIAALIAVILLVPATSFAQASGALKAELGKYLEELKDNPDPQARQAAVMALGQIADRKQSRELEAYKLDDHDRVRLGAGMALMLAGDRSATAFVAGELAESGALFKTLREVVSVLPVKQEEALLRELLKKGTPEVQRDVFRYLSHQQGPLYAMLGAPLSDANAEKRGPAMMAALSTVQPATLGFATAMLKSRDEGVRLDAVRIGAALKSNPSAVADVTPFFELALKDSSAAVQEAAARQLVELRNPAGTQALVDMLVKADSEKRKQIALFLLDHEVRPRTAALKSLLDSVEDAQEKAILFELAAAARDQETYDRVAKMFSSNDFDERLVSTQALGRTRNPDALALLARGVFEGRREIRLNCARGLGHVQNDEALPVLRRVLTGERDKEVKVAAIEAVGKYKSPQAITMLRFLTTDNDPDVKKAVVFALGSIGLPEGMAALEILFRDRNLEIQWQAFVVALSIDSVAALRHASSALRSPADGYINDINFHALPPSARESLGMLLLKHSGARTRLAALSRFVALGEPMLPVLRKAVMDAAVTDDVRREIVLVLAERRAPEDKPLLERIVREAGAKELGQLAAWGLVRYRANDLEPSFRGYLGHESSIIRAIATYGLATMEK